MWWAQMIVGAIDGWLQGSAGRATAQANNKISKVNAETGNKTRQWRNTATAATNNFARWQQSLNNQRILKAGGEQLEANTQNYLRQVDAHSYDDINRSLGDAEMMGAQAAQAGAVGMIGGVADMVDVSTRIRSGIVDQIAKDQTAYASHDQARRAGMIFSQTVQSLDSSLIIDTFDNGIDYAQETPVFSHWANAIQGVGKSFGVGGQGADVMKNWDSRSKTTPQDESPYSLSSAGNAKFGFKGPPSKDELPSSDNDWSIGSTRLGDKTSSYYDDKEKVNPYSLWSGSNG